MSPYEMQLRTGGASANNSTGRTPSVRDYALLEEYSFVRREAQAEADVAYEHWRTHSTRDSYTIYRAAQDRADAAQDDLADWTRSLTA
jgi:hypothetical protein